MEHSAHPISHQHYAALPLPPAKSDLLCIGSSNKPAVELPRSTDEEPGLDKVNILFSYGFSTGLNLEPDFSMT